MLFWRRKRSKKKSGNKRKKKAGLFQSYRRKRSSWKKKWKAGLFLLLLLAALFCTACPDLVQEYAPWLPQLLWHGESSATLENIPDYSGTPYVVLNYNQPEFTEDEITTIAYESYSVQDLLGRCGPAVACVGQELMPTQERESISSVTPSGWQTQKYDFVDQEYLYNRCHLIGFQLTGENANERNLITGTRYMNVDGMLPFENQVADYIESTGNHVMYRVTPIFEGPNLVADGVQMEAYSVEDGGAGVCFNVFVYNVQPGVVINYLTGSSRVASVYLSFYPRSITFA